MSAVNKVFLMGNLTRDPEIRYIPSGQAVTTLGLAVNEKRKKDGETIEDVLFIDITVWSKMAENCVEYLGKGSPVFVEGRLRLNTWEQDGTKRSKIDVTALNVQFLSRGEGKPAEAQEGDFNPPDGGEEIPF